MAPEDIDLEKALALLALPREVGMSPEDGEPILAGVGRFGPYVKHGKVYASLEDGDDVLTVGLNRAVTLIADKIANPKKGRRLAPIPARRWATIPTRADRSWSRTAATGPMSATTASTPPSRARQTAGGTITLDRSHASRLLDACAADQHWLPSRTAPPAATSVWASDPAPKAAGKKPPRQLPSRWMTAERHRQVAQEAGLP